MSRFTPRSRKAWRDWLAKHHAQKDEVWLVFYKKGTGKPTLSYNDSVEEALCFGWIDGIRKSIDDERYMHRFSPRKPSSNWSESNRKRVAHLEEAGLMTPAGQKLVDEAKRNGMWEQDAHPQIDLSIPEELSSRLAKNKRAQAFFESLAPSYQRQYIGWIASARRDDTRQRRADEALKLLKKGEKLGMR